MYNFDKWLVYFDYDNEGLSDLQNVAQVASFFVPEEIHITFFPQQVDLPLSVLADMPNIKQANTQQQEEQILGWIQQAFHPEMTVKLHALNGKPLPTLLNYAIQNKVDLFVLQSASLKKGSSLPKKLVRKIPASILSLPKEPMQELSHVLFPVDFSEHNDLIKKMIVRMHTDFGFRKVEALHVYKDASRYLERVFETADEIKEILSKRSKINEQLERNANHQMSAYFVGVKTPEILWKTKAMERGGDVAYKILENAPGAKPVFLVFGSKGESSSIASLLGGVAEQLILNSPHLNLMVKLPDENRGFLRSLLAR